MYSHIRYFKLSTEVFKPRILQHNRSAFCTVFFWRTYERRSFEDSQPNNISQFSSSAEFGIRKSCSIEPAVQNSYSVKNRSQTGSTTEFKSACTLFPCDYHSLSVKQSVFKHQTGHFHSVPKYSCKNTHSAAKIKVSLPRAHQNTSHSVKHVKNQNLNSGLWSSQIYKSYHSGFPYTAYSTTTSEAEKWKQGTQPGIDMKYFLNIGDFENKLFDYLCDANGKLPITKFKKALFETGLRETDPRLEDCMRMIKIYQSKLANEEELGDSCHGYIDREYFKECIAKNIVVLSNAFRSRFVIPDFGTFCQHIDDIYWKVRDVIGGKVATYIPQLARYSPNLWGVSVCTVDGQRYSLGDVNMPFSMQSVSKPLSYSLVLDDLSPEVVHQYVGHEPSGVAFNSIGLNYKDKPHNPMVNAGAIVIGSLLKQELPLPDRFDFVSQMLQRLTGGEYVAFNNSVFLSERETADRNFALAYYMREKKCFPDGTNLMEVMDFYFQLCSIEINCESGSVMAATLANGGICPITGDKVLSSMAVRDTLSLMHSCGMYDYSGEFAFKVGLPAKSGVSGGILLVVPNIMGIFMWSPALDIWGNSVRGVQFCQDLVGKFNFHNYDNLRFTSKKINPCKRKQENQTHEVVNLLFGAYNGDVSALRRFAMRDVNMNLADYDGRTALHIGAAEGHEGVVRFLLEKCNCNPHVVDRWGLTPDKDAERFGHSKVAEILKRAMKEHEGQGHIQSSIVNS